jgi:hypothetical protein
VPTAASGRGMATTGRGMTAAAASRRRSSAATRVSASAAVIAGLSRCVIVRLRRCAVARHRRIASRCRSAVLIGAVRIRRSIALGRRPVTRTRIRGLRPAKLMPSALAAAACEALSIAAARPRISKPLPAVVSRSPRARTTIGHRACILPRNLPVLEKPLIGYRSKPRICDSLPVRKLVACPTRPYRQASLNEAGTAKLVARGKTKSLMRAAKPVSCGKNSAAPECRIPVSAPHVHIP